MAFPLFEKYFNLFLELIKRILLFSPWEFLQSKLVKANTPSYNLLGNVSREKIRRGG